MARKSNYRFSRENSGRFQFETEEFNAKRGFFANLFGRSRRDRFSRYIAAGGTRDTQRNAQTERAEHSLRNLTITWGLILIGWLVLYFF